MNKLITLIFVSILATACGDIQSNSRNLSSSSGPCTNCSQVHLKVDLNSPTKVLNQNHTLQNYRSCLGLDKLNSNIVSQYNSLKGSLSYDGQPNSLNNTVTFANLKAAAVVCNAFIEQEASGIGLRKIFNTFQLSDSDQLRAGGTAGAIEKIAQNCWGRNLASDELDQIQQKTRSAFGNNTTSRQAALFICTAMLSTPEAMKQ